MSRKFGLAFHFIKISTENIGTTKMTMFGWTKSNIISVVCGDHITVALSKNCHSYQHYLNYTLQFA